MLLPKDYIRFELTGEHATEVSDASGTALFDVVMRRWSHQMLDALKLDRALLARVYESSEVTGRVTARAAELTGLAEGTPVVGGGGDQAASAVGNGIVEPGMVSCTLGHFGSRLRPHGEGELRSGGPRSHLLPRREGRVACDGGHPGRRPQPAVVPHQFAPGADYDALTAEAATSPPCANGLFWLPYMMGERTPHLDSTARGGWIGITASHTRADLIRALLEGVCYSQRDCLDIIDHLGATFSSVRLSGGGARSPFWRQLFADVFGRRVTTLASQEGSAYGAAILAQTGTGEFASVPEACRAVIREVDAIMPRPFESQLYRRGHEVYRALYPSLRPIYGLIENLR